LCQRDLAGVAAVGGFKFAASNEVEVSICDAAVLIPGNRVEDQDSIAGGGEPGSPKHGPEVLLGGVGRELQTIHKIHYTHITPCLHKAIKCKRIYFL